MTNRTPKSKDYQMRNARQLIQKPKLKLTNRITKDKGLNDNLNISFLENRNQKNMEDYTDTINKRNKVKTFLQNAVNAITGIVFNSHADRFRSTFNQINCTPGPCYYNINHSFRAIGNYSSLNHSPINQIFSSRHSPIIKLGNKSIKKKEQQKNVTYYNKNLWIKNSYNITIPHNILKRRKESLLKMRLELLKK